MSLTQLLFSSQGRIPRSTYWIYAIVYNFAITPIVYLASVLDEIFQTFSKTGVGYLYFSILFISFIPGWLVAIKRCHDRDRSGWFLLLGLVPFVNFWVAIEVLFLKGTTGPNRFGPDPLGAKRDRVKPKTAAREPQYDFGPYTNLDDDQFRYDSYGSRDNDAISDYAATDKQSSQNEIFGMSPIEIIILAILSIVICVFGSFVGLRFLYNSDSKTVSMIQLPTATFAPTTTPTPTTTPIVRSTPIPGWSQFTFDDGKGEIWLPSSYQGGDTVAYPEIVEMTIETFITDEVVVEAFKETITDPLMSFFAFDTQPAAFPRSMYIRSENIPADTIFDMENYLDMTSKHLEEKGRGVQIIEHRLISLDYYDDAGLILAQDTVPKEDGDSKFVFTVAYAIRTDDLVWVIVFVVDGIDLKVLLPIIEDSARSFYWRP
jgi:uncharacterized membrane protein YhaH (DUF805 family)